MIIDLNRKSSQPLYLQIKEQVKTLISNGSLSPGTKLPSSRDLAKQLGVTRITVNNAYFELEAEDLVKGWVGKGTFVSNSKLPQIDNEDNVDEQIAGLITPWERTAYQDDLSNELALHNIVNQSQSPDIISFASGLPSSDFFPVSDFQKSFNNIFRFNCHDAMQYDLPEGNPQLRKLIAAHLNIKQDINPQQVLITSGAQQAIDLVARVFIQPGDIVLTESPTYGGAIATFSAMGGKVVGVPMDNEGIRIDILEQAIKKYNPRFLYTVSVFNNPTGLSLSKNRKKALLSLCRKNNLPIIEDNPYNALYYDDKPKEPLLTYDEHNCVIHIGSFSKLLLPGLRLGYIIVPNNIYKAFVNYKQICDLNTSPLIQRVVFEYIKSGQYNKHLRNIRKSCQERRDITLETMKNYFPSDVIWTKPKGGLYLWVTLPPDIPLLKLYMDSLKQGVAIALGSLFYPNRATNNSFRINFCLHSSENIKKGISILGDIMNKSRYDVDLQNVSTGIPFL